MKKLTLAILALAVSFSAFAKKEETEKFDRGIGVSSSVFIPKGSVGFGAAFSYATYDIGNSADDYGYKALFGVLGGVHAQFISGGVSPHVSYFVMDNLAVGGRFNFKRNMLDVGSAALNLTEDMSFGIDDFHYFKDSYSGAIFARYFIPFGNSKRFAMFSELRAVGGYGQSETYKLSDLDKHGTYQDIYDFEIGVVPGLCAFVTNTIALEVAIGLVGLNYQKVVQKTNQVGVSVMENSGANFRINLLDISLGISFYLPTGKNR